MTPADLDITNGNPQIQGLHGPLACFIDDTEYGFLPNGDQRRGTQRLAFFHGQASVDKRGRGEEFVPISTFDPVKGLNSDVFAGEFASLFPICSKK